MKSGNATSASGTRALLEQLAADPTAWETSPPSLTDVDLLESKRHGGTTRSERSATQSALDRLGSEVKRQRMAAAPEIDLSPFSPKMLEMDRVASKSGVDFNMLREELAAIHHVRSLENLGNGGLPRASLGGHFDCEFARDSTSIARDLGHEFPDLFRALVMRLASLQGQAAKVRSENAIVAALLLQKSGGDDRQAVKSLVDTLLNRYRREEEDGRIFHENRSDQRGEELEAAGWGFPYYGATDTAPGFVTSAWRYLSLYPDTAFLDEPVMLDPKVDPKRSLITVREASVNALRWIVRRMDDPRGAGFLWNQKMEDHGGIANQSWMDSGDSFEFDGAYAPVELQGMAYDALLCGAEMLSANQGPKGRHAKASSEASRELESRAEKLRASFFEQFAIVKDGQFEMFAHSIRAGADGAIEQSRWMKSNAGRLLDSRLFDTDDPKILAMRDALIDRLFEDDMRGPFGLIRTMSNQHPRYNPLAYHNGSIWPTDNMAIAHGLLRQRDNTTALAERVGGEAGLALKAKADQFGEKAESLMRGILEACAGAAKQGFPAPEWIPGDAMPIPQKEEFVVEDGRKRVTALSPMRVQGWTVSAMWAAASYLADQSLASEDADYQSSAARAKARRVPMPQEHPSSRT